MTIKERLDIAYDTMAIYIDDNPECEYACEMEDIIHEVFEDYLGGDLDSHDLSEQDLLNEMENLLNLVKQ